MRGCGEPELPSPASIAVGSGRRNHPLPTTPSEARAFRRARDNGVNATALKLSCCDMDDTRAAVEPEIAVSRFDDPVMLRDQLGADRMLRKRSPSKLASRTSRRTTDGFGPNKYPSRCRSEGHL